MTAPGADAGGRAASRARAPHRAYLADFGLARVVASGSRYTQTGEALGTPAYMSPEQARGSAPLTAGGETRGLTPATDVWALGCVCCEVLAGRRAFEGATAAEVIHRVVTCEAPNLRALCPDLPAGLDAIVRVALAKRPESRHPDARAFSLELARVLRGEPPVLRPAGARGRWRLAVGSAAAALTVGVTLAWPGGAPPPVRGPGPSAAGADAERVAARALAERHVDPERAARGLREALALAPERHAWRVELGLIEWTRGDPAAAERAWGSVPPAADEADAAGWLRGLLLLAEGLAIADRTSQTAARRAWTAVGDGAGPEAIWARAGLAVIGGAYDEARALLGDADQWAPSLLRGMCELQALRARIHDSQI